MTYIRLNITSTINMSAFMNRRCFLLAFCWLALAFMGSTWLSRVLGGLHWPSGAGIGFLLACVGLCGVYVGLSWAYVAVAGLHWSS